MDLDRTQLPKRDKQGNPRCFNCNKFGHFAKDCNMKKKPYNKSQRKGKNRQIDIPEGQEELESEDSDFQEGEE